MRKLFIPLACAACAISAPAHAAYTFVGSWYVGDGPRWDTNPGVFSAREAAALLFGGSASDYAISTTGSDVNAINFMSHVDGWGDDTFLTSTVAQDYKLDTGAPGYADPGGGGSAYSAYVLDHSCDNRYNNPNEACLANQRGQNFAFRIDGGAVPEPSTWALLILGFGAVGGAMRRTRREVGVSFA